MSLAGNVIPGVLQQMATLVPAGAGNGVVPPGVTASGPPSAPLKGVSFGAKLSVPISPWCWVQNSSGSEMQPVGSSLIVTPHVIVIRILHRFPADPASAELILTNMVDPIRAAFRTNTMLIPAGAPTVRTSWISGWDWGYVLIDDQWFRYVDLNCEVQEKEAIRYS